MYHDHYPFELIPLPYAYNALEPHIDARTMHLHHDQHLKTYVDNLNNALADYPQFHQWPLRKLLLDVEELPESIRTAVINNGGGVYNHDLYFSLMVPHARRMPGGALLQAIIRTFGSYDAFAEQLKTAALDRFGSGWAWLAVNPDRQLVIVSTANQDTVLSQMLCPVLLVDVWEHAYYLKYQNRRAEYIDNWFKVINWNLVETRYANCMQRG